MPGVSFDDENRWWPDCQDGGMADGERTGRQGGLGPVVAAALVLAVVTACVALLVSGDGGEQAQPGPVGVATTFVREPLVEPEGWEPMADSPLQGRAEPATAWTGTELLVWGGDGAFSDGGGGEPGRSDGAAYDPASDTWRPMANSPLPEPENAIGASDYASAWTGSELLVWGGPGPKAAAYDPVADSWRRLDPGPLAERTQFASVWTGSELVIIGGYAPLADSVDMANDGVWGDAAAYDPATQRWRDLPGTGLERTGAAVWTGSEIVWVADSRSAEGTAGIALALDPDGGGWRRLAEPPLARFTAAPVWTGSELVAIGALVRVDPDQPNPGETHGGVASYDPVSDTWTEIEPPEGLRVDHLSLPAAVWTGTEVLVLGSSGPFVPVDDVIPLSGVAYDPESGTWRMLPDPSLSDRGGMASAWIGTELLLWGGERSTGFTSEPRDDGARYRPGPGR